MRLSKLSVLAISLCILAICGYVFRDSIGIFIFKNYTGFGLEHYQYMFLIVPLAIILLLAGLDYTRKAVIPEEFQVNTAALKTSVISLAVWVGCCCVATIIGYSGNEKYDGIINLFVIPAWISNISGWVCYVFAFGAKTDSNGNKLEKTSIIFAFAATIAIYIFSYRHLSDNFQQYFLPFIVTLFMSSALLMRSLKSNKTFIPRILLGISFLSLFCGELYNLVFKINPIYIPTISIAITFTLLIVALDLAKQIAKTQPITDNLNQQQ